VVEIANATNSPVWFHPVGRALRGRWARINVPARCVGDGDIALLPDLPGLRIKIDARQRCASIYDPMGESENKDALERFQRVMTQLGPIRVKEGPEQPERFPNMDNTALKTWLFWIRRTVNAGMAEIVSGHLPDLAAIARLPGRTRVGYGEGLVVNKPPRYLEDVPQ
jgi:hypothetical protein